MDKSMPPRTGRVHMDKKHCRLFLCSDSSPHPQWSMFDLFIPIWFWVITLYVLRVQVQVYKYTLILSIRETC